MTTISRIGNTMLTSYRIFCFKYSSKNRFEKNNSYSIDKQVLLEYFCWTKH